MSNKKAVYKFWLCILGAILAALIISFGSAVFYYVRGVDYREGRINIQSSWIHKENPIEKKNEAYIVSERGGEIEIWLPEKIYIHKLEYRYKASRTSERGCKIKFYIENIYGEDSVKEIDDFFFQPLYRSVVNVKGKVSKIEFIFPDESARLELSNFIIDNSFKWNPFLAEIVMTIVFLVLFLIFFRKENVIHPGFASFVCIFVLSVCMLFLQPAYCAGADEEIHFLRSYDLAVTFDYGSPPSVINYLLSNYPWLNFHHEASAEEHIDLIRLMNHMGETRETTALDKDGFQIYSIGYLCSAIGISVGRFLGLPFYFVWILGKFANVLLYAVGISVAVSIVPIGKRLLMVISLFPTLIFSCTTYTYDITVIVFLTIGICIWIREVMEYDLEISYKWRIVYFICMFVGCMPKAVYAPLILIALFLPLTKFSNTKDKYIFKGSIIFCFGLLVSTYVLPTLLVPSNLGDVRNGAASVSGQLTYIFHKPISYAVVLLCSINRELIRYISGDMFTGMGYWGTKTLATCYTIFVTGTAITDTYGESYEKKYKMISLLTISATVVLIWTALYLSFTTVGETQIIGVQGRYYLPFIFMFYLLFRSNKIKNEFEVERYQGVVVGISCILLISQIIIDFFIGSCI